MAFFFEGKYMNYISNTAYGCQIYQKNQIIKKDMNTLTYVKKLCLTYLFTYKGYIEACRKVLNLKYKIPLYISDRLQLIPVKSIRDYDNIWINYAYVKTYSQYKDSLIIVFYDGTQIVANISINTFRTQIKRLNAIRDIKVKHFHS
jgi:competence transcription factor ComK